METLKTTAIYTGGIIGAIIAFHVIILTFMVLGIYSAPEQVAHTDYWDGLLKAVIALAN